MPITLSRIAKRRKNKELEAGVYGYIIFKITDHGKVVMRRKREMHSLTALWFLMLWAGYSHTTPSLEAYYPNSFNINTLVYFSNANEGFWLAASSPYVGIVVGTGQAAKNPQDYTLAAPVTPSSTGLSYSPLTMSSPTVSGNTSTLSMSRVFTNNGSSSITLTEAAILVYCSLDNSTTVDFDAAIAYDYISPSITLSPGQTLTVTYQIQVTMRKGDTPWIPHRFYCSY
jgi:hypothetical protein